MPGTHPVTGHILGSRGVCRVLVNHLDAVQLAQAVAGAQVGGPEVACMGQDDWLVLCQTASIIGLAISLGVPLITWERTAINAGRG